MVDLIFQGKNRTSQNPHISTTSYPINAIDCFGRNFVIPAGSTIKQFETTNKGWIIWRESDRTGHIRDLG